MTRHPRRLCANVPKVMRSFKLLLVTAFVISRLILCDAHATRAYVRERTDTGQGYL